MSRVEEFKVILDHLVRPHSKNKTRTLEVAQRGSIYLDRRGSGFQSSTKRSETLDIISIDIF